MVVYNQEDEDIVAAIVKQMLLAAASSGACPGWDPVDTRRRHCPSCLTRRAKLVAWDDYNCKYDGNTRYRYT